MKSYYKTIDTESSKSIYFYLQKNLIQTEEFLNDINLESYTNTRIDFDSSDRSSTGLMFSFFLYSDDKIKKISRKYQNINNLLASIGGIANILIIVGTVMAKIQNSLNVKNEIINELYLYSNFKKKQKKNKMEFSNNLPSPLNYNENRNSAKKNTPSGKSSLKIKDFDIFTREKHNKHKYFLGLFHYFFLFFKRKKKFTEQEKLFKKGEDLYFKDVDIIEILKKIKEIDKLKFILLDPTQRFLFNLLSKSMLNSNQDFKNEINVNTSKITSMDYSINSSQSIKQNYYNLLKKNNKSEIDERILRLIDKNVYNFIKFNN